RRRTLRLTGPARSASSEPRRAVMRAGSGAASGSGALALQERKQVRPAAPLRILEHIPTEKLMLHRRPLPDERLHQSERTSVAEGGVQHGTVPLPHSIDVSPAAISDSATGQCPRTQAQNSALAPSLAVALGSAPRRKSSRTRSRWPSYAARIRGVNPSDASLLIAAPL